MDFRIEKKVIKLDKSTLDGKVVSYNSDYVANFIFDEEWEDKVKTVRFINNGEYVDVVLTDTDSCKIPLEVMRSGQLEVGVFAGNLQTTTVARVTITASILEETGVPADPTDDIYTQIMEKLDEIDAASGADGGWSIVAEDDGEGNVAVTMTGYTVSDDGEGNVAVTMTGYTVSDDGEGNVAIM